MNRRALPLASLQVTSLAEAEQLAKAQPDSRILHVRAGDETWEPTQEEIEQIAQMFTQADILATGESIGSVIVTRSGVEAFQFEPKSGTITLVTMGDETWEPTQEEMLIMRDLWDTAINDPSGSVIVTRQGCDVLQLDLANAGTETLQHILEKITTELARRVT